MPTRVFRDQSNLAAGLLDVILADVGCSCGECVTYGLRSFRLGRADDGDFFWPTAAAQRDLSHMRTYARVIGGNVHHASCVSLWRHNPAERKASNTSSIGSP